MMKNFLQIDIPEPCSQKFNDMTPTQGGRHCGQCDKTIVDFSTLSDKEVADIFKKKNGKICGQFHKSQLNRKINLDAPKFISTYGKAASLLLSGLFSASVLSANNNSFPIIIENQETVSNLRTPIDDFLEKNKTKEIIIKGQVIDETGEALIGANVILSPSHEIGTTTDIDGNFELIIPEKFGEDFSLRISYTGFEDVNWSSLENKSILNQPIEIVMNEGLLLMGDIICVGYSEDYEWKPEGNFLLDIEAGLRRFFKKRKEKKAERKARKFKKQNQSLVKEKITRGNAPLRNDLIKPIPKFKFQSKLKSVFPNPFSSEIVLEIESEINSDVEITIFNTKGSIVYFSKENLLEGKQNITIDLQDKNLTDGSYFLQIKNKNGIVGNHKIVKAKLD